MTALLVVALYLTAGVCLTRYAVKRDSRWNTSSDAIAITLLWPLLVWTWATFKVLQGVTWVLDVAGRLISSGVAMTPVHTPPRPRPRAPAPEPPTPAAPPAERVRHWWGWVRHMVRPGAPGAPPVAYNDRYSLRAQGPSGTNPWRVYLHHFLAADSEGHHNHPSAWSFSIVLWGSYTEEVLVRPETWGCTCVPLCGSVIHTRRVRWFNWIPASKYHRVTELHPGPGARGVWTLFVCGPLTGRGWGFWQAGRGHVPVLETDGK